MAPSWSAAPHTEAPAAESAQSASARAAAYLEKLHVRIILGHPRYIHR